MSAPIFIQRPSMLAGLAGLGSTGVATLSSEPAGPDATQVRVFSAVSVVLSAALGYGAYRLFKSQHPGWGTFVAIGAVGGLANNVVGLVTGKQWWGGV